MAKIACISTSMAEHSRSRAALKAAETMLKESDHDIVWVDVRDFDQTVYPNGKDGDKMKAALDEADAWVIGAPVHNWGPATSTVNFFTYALSKETQQYKPFTIILGAGSPASYLVDGLSKKIKYEAQGVEIGAAIVAAGDSVNKETGEVTEKLQERIEKKMRAFLKFV